MTENIHHLSDDLGATLQDNDSVILLDTRGHNPIPKETLTSEEMTELMNLWTNGCCPICLDEIPSSHLLCRHCLLHEASERMPDVLEEYYHMIPRLK